MTPAQWSRIKQILAEALDRAPAQRGPYLDSRCGEDDALRREVELLLVAAESADSLLDAETPFGSLSEHAPSAENRVGERLGSYEIIEEIGHGGMGTVYAARRADAAYEKTVAIKLVRREAAGESMLRRFRSERQIVASLDHPNVARLLDGGTTEKGEPYLVMEYVDGDSLLHYCDEKALGVPARVRLFQQVCGAVQAAHQRLIVHRDIKPANILVDRDGVPKLLDFGIAKLLDPENASSARGETGAFARVMTPDYASPEQILGRPITTAADIYALGVVLYELLTGRLPYPDETEPSAMIERALSPREPERPSAAVTTKEAAGENEERSRRRGETPSGLARRLRGDLDAIVRKAIRSEPERRYASAEQLSADLERYLTAQPVQARRGGFSYLAGKFLRRHRAAAAAAGLVLIAIAGGVWATIRESRRARAAEARAERRFEDVRRLANSFLFEFHDAIRQLPGATKPRALILAKAREYLDGLAREASGNSALQRELAESYLKLGEVSGGFGGQNLGDVDMAWRSYRSAFSIAQELAGKEPGPENRRLLARSLEKISRASRRGDRHVKRAIAICEELTASSPDDVENLRCLEDAYDELGNRYADVRDLESLVPARRRQVAIAERLMALTPADAGFRRNRALAYKKLGAVLQVRGDLPGAMPYFRKALEIDQERARAEPANVQAQRDLSFSIGTLAGALADGGNYAEGLAGYRRALAIRQSLADADPADVNARRAVASAHQKLAEIALSAGNFEEAQRNGLSAVRVYQELPDGASLAEATLALAQAHELSAARISADERMRQSLAESRSWYAKSYAEWKALEKAGDLTKAGREKSAGALAGIARCDAALTRKRG